MIVRLVSFQIIFFFFKPNLSTVHASLFVQLLYVVLVNSLDRLLNYLMLVQELIEVKIEMLKNHDLKIQFFLLNRLRTLLKLVTHYTSGHKLTKFAMG